MAISIRIIMLIFKNANNSDDNKMKKVPRP